MRGSDVENRFNTLPPARFYAVIAVMDLKDYTGGSVSNDMAEDRIRAGSLLHARHRKGNYLETRHIM